MYCSKCGSQIADGSRFCSFCGAPVAEVPDFTPEPEVPAAEPPAPVEPEPEPVRKPFIEEINWNVNEYPSTDTIEKTDDIDFDWGADPAEIRERLTREYPETVKEEIRQKADALNVEDLIPSKPVQPEIPASPVDMEELSAADKIDKFYTFSRKNEEFQQLLNREYDKIKGGNLIEKEKEIADKAAAEKFEARAEDSSMEAFLNREGVNKPYEPKAFESDVLQRIEAHERALEQARAEEEARRKMIEEERAKAAAEMRAAEEARIKAEEEERERIAREARALAEEEVRRAEEAARLAAEEAAAAEEEAARLEAEAAAKLAAEEEAKKLEDARLAKEAVEEARLKAEERAKAEAEERARAEEEAIRKIEEESKAKAEEEARLAAEEEERRREEEEKARIEAAEALIMQQQADKIRAQQEARQAATEKEKRIAEIERRRQEEEALRSSLDRKQDDLRLQAESAAAAEEARKVLASTKQMREEEAAKIRAAIAGLKGEPIKEEPAVPAEPIMPETPAAPPEPTIHFSEDEFKAALEASEEVAPETPAPAVSEPTIVVKPEPPKPVEKEVSKEEAARIAAHTATQADLTKMAEARAKFLSEFGIDPVSGKAPEPTAEPAEPVPATVEELLGEKPVTTRDTMISQINDAAQTKTVNKDEVIRGLEHTRRISKEELKATPVIPAEELESETLTGIKEVHHNKTVEQMLEELSAPAEATELGAVLLHEDAEPVPDVTPEAVEDIYEPTLGQGDVAAGEATETEPEVPETPAFEVPESELPDVVEPILEIPEPAEEPAPAEPAAEPAPEEPEEIAEGFAVKEEPTVVPDEVASEGLKPGLDNTMVMTGIGEEVKEADESFAEYGEEEAEQLRQMQEADAAAEEAVAEEPAQEAPAPAPVAKAAPAKEKGGAGRKVLKVLLVILIVILVIELAGIAIKWLAPDSGAAEFIDNQLNKIIHLITGTQPDYQVPGIDYEV